MEVRGEVGFGGDGGNRNGFPVREWQKMRERNEALDCYVYARAAAAAAGLDRYKERHWRELERQLGMVRATVDPPPTLLQPVMNDEATPSGGFVDYGSPKPLRRIVRSRWMR